MSATYEQLVQELGARFDGAFLATATSGTATTLVCPAMLARIPQAVTSQLNWWVYGPNEADVANCGAQSRASSWDSATAGGTMTLYAPGMPGAIGTGTYEIHPGVERTRKGAAINAAVGQLGLIYWRNFVDTSITTVEANNGAVGTNGWQYNLTTLITPNIPISRISQIEIQVSSDNTLLIDGGFPYMDARDWNYDIYFYDDASGVRQWILQFGVLPPPGRVLRIKGEAYASKLVNDTDILPLTGQWEYPAYEWIYDYAQFVLNQSLANDLSQMDAQRWRQQEFDRLQTSKERILLMAPTHENSRIVVPGRGDGLYSPDGANDSSWMGAMRGTH